MKLNEILNPKITPEIIAKAMGVSKASVKIAPNDVITINYTSQKGGHAASIPSDFIVDGKLTIKFDSITISSKISDPIKGTTTSQDGSMGTHFIWDLKTLEGFPSKFVGDFYLRNVAIENFIGGFKNFNGTLSISNLDNLKSLRGLPPVFNGVLRLSYLDIDHFDYLPNYFSGTLAWNNLKNFTSLVGIEKAFNQNFKGTIQSDFATIKEGGLGLLLIDGLKRINVSWGHNKLPEPFEIINKYIGKNDIFSCQEELLDKGYEEFTKL